MISDRWKDRLNLLRKSRLARWIAGAVVFGLMVTAISASLPSLARKAAASAKEGGGDGSSIRPDLATAAEMRAMGLAAGEESRGRTQQMKEMMGELSRTRTAMETMAGRMEKLETLRKDQDRPPAPPEEFLQSPSIRVQESEQGTKEEKTKGLEGGKLVAVPAGSYGNGTLLTGIYAPIDGASLPVVVRLNEVLVGPNRSRIPIEGALLVGRATGDANSERAQIEITTVAFVDSEGRAHEMGSSGFAVARDGYLGVPGQYVWRVGDTLFPAMAASGLAGAADIFQMSRRRVRVGALGSQSIDFKGDEFASAGFSALGAAADKLSQILSERIQEVRPAIAVGNGAAVTVVFQSGFEIPVDPKLLGESGRRSHDDVDSKLDRDR